MSKFGNTPTSASRVPDHCLGLSAWNELPFAETAAAMRCSSSDRKKISLPLGDHRIDRAPSVDTRHLP